METGTTLNHYKITAKLGEGGMGEVYRAEDTRLKRDVALKVLPADLAGDAERIARMEREAQVLAALEHPNIAAIHGIEEMAAEGEIPVRFLVMQLAEGKTLADRIIAAGADGLPTEETLRIALQIAKGLEAAHDRGVIHRDLKPTNVQLSDDSQVKILDFGLAKAHEADGSRTGPDLSASPTMADATRAGMILGTAPYMSPEQARGQPVDRRADIWAFGCVLYEMLTATRAFDGDTVTDVLGSIVHKEPNLEALPEETPWPMRDLLRRCLTKDAGRRLQAIGEARIAIEDYLADPSGAVAVRAAGAAPEPAWQGALPWALLAATAMIAAVASIGWWQLSRPVEAPPMRFNVMVAESDLFRDQGASAVLSPDGTHMAYILGSPTGTAMYVRSLDQLEGTELESGIPYNPFFSPDGRWIGYVTPSELKKVPVTGGTPLTLCPVNRSRGASWGPDDTIVFAPSPNSGLFRVAAAGGEPEQLTELDEGQGEFTHRWPQLLPGARAVLFTSHTEPVDFDNASIEVLLLDTDERKVVHRGGSYARYLPSGHLVYSQGGALFAVPFDIDRLEVSGSPAPIVEKVSSNPAEGGSEYSFSDTGTLAYMTGETEVPEYPVVWVDRRGNTTSLWQEAGTYIEPRLSPDGTRLVMTILTGDNYDIWVYDLERGVPTRLTFYEGEDSAPVWSPEGEYVAFASERDGAPNLYRKRADGSGEVERLTESDNSQYPDSWSPDGSFLTYSELTPDASYELMILSLEGGPEPVVFLSTPFRELFPQLSPDGRWIAYQSNESGQDEVYVRPYPPAGGRWQVSDAGGAAPRWSGDGGELFYRTDTGIMVVAVETRGDSFRMQKPERLFEGAFQGGMGGVAIGSSFFQDYDNSADGQTFVMFPRLGESAQEEIGHVTIVLNWFDELRRVFSAAED